MSAEQTDENTPLLQVRSEPTPNVGRSLPLLQIAVLLVLQLAEQLPAYVIGPFAPDLIRGIGITHGDESKVGYYVGLMQSVVSIAQALSVLLWGRLSDHVGRKPIILIGLVGISLPTFCFGLSQTYTGLIVSRGISGALDGNLGVLKSIMAEITDAKTITQAYSYLPISWLLASSFGPLIGGMLSRPSEQFPGLFGHSVFMQKHPYFLACAFPATFAVAVFFLTSLLLHESHPRRKRGPPSRQKSSDSGEMIQAPPADSTTKPPPLRALLTRPVLISIGNYGLLTLVDSAFRAIQPVYLSTPIALGGLGMSPPTIGKMLSVYGVCNGMLQVLLLSRVTDRMGQKRVYLLGIACLLPIYASFPLLNRLARTEGVRVGAGAWAGLVAQGALSIPTGFCHGSIYVFVVAAAAPGGASLGSVVGLAQTCGALVRAAAYVLADALFAFSTDAGPRSPVPGGLLVYGVLAFLTGVAFYAGTFLPSTAMREESNEQ